MPHPARTLLIALAAALCVLGPAADGAALDKCKLKQAKDGTLLFSATDVKGSLRIGYQPDVVSRRIPDGPCLEGGVAKGCVLASTGEEARTTPPPRCELYVEDAEDGCTVPLKRCVPGLRPACPPDMQRLGGGCIEREVNPGVEFGDAVATCHVRGRSVCSLEHLLTCDVLNLSNGTPGSCGNLTDTPSGTWTLGSNAEDGGSPFNRLVWYDGNNLIREQSQASGGMYRFFCCAPLGAE